MDKFHNIPVEKKIQLTPSEGKQTRRNIQDIVGTRKRYHIETHTFKFNPVDTQRNGGGRGKGVNECKIFERAS